MRHSDQISSVFFLCFGIFVLSYTLIALPIGTLRNPEAGLFPLFVGLAITIFSIVIVVKAFRERKVQAAQFGNLWKKVFYTILEVILYVVLLEQVGFVICTLLFVFFYIKGIERIGWLKSFVYTISTVFVTYFIFIFLFGVPLPMGIVQF